MVRAGQPRASSEAMGTAPTSAGQLRAEQGGKESEIAPQTQEKTSGFLWMDWHRMWKHGLGPITINAHRSPGSLKDVKAAWLREQGEWSGANAASEGWVLLEGRTCEIARAEARESVLFIGTQFSILYTFMYSPA